MAFQILLIFLPIYYNFNQYDNSFVAGEITDFGTYLNEYM